MYLLATRGRMPGIQPSTRLHLCQALRPIVWHEVTLKHFYLPPVDHLPSLDFTTMQNTNDESVGQASRYLGSSPSSSPTPEDAVGSLIFLFSFATIGRHPTTLSKFSCSGSDHHLISQQQQKYRKLGESVAELFVDDETIVEGRYSSNINMFLKFLVIVQASKSKNIVLKQTVAKLFVEGSNINMLLKFLVIVRASKKRNMI